MNTHFIEAINKDQRIWWQTSVLKNKKRAKGKVDFLTQNKIWVKIFALDRSSLENLFMQLRTTFLGLTPGLIQSVRYLALPWASV